MKKICILLLVLFVGHSCENPVGVITENGKLTISDTYDYNRNNLDTAMASFLLYAEFEVLYFSNNWSPVPSAKAFTSTTTFANSIDMPSLQLTIDRPFQVDDKRIAAHQDILAELYPPEKRNVFYATKTSSSFEIHFTEEILARCQFENGQTTFTLTGKNSDGISFSLTAQTVIAMASNTN